MIFDFFDSLSRFFSVFGTILNFFTEIKITLEGVLTTIDTFDFLTVVSPYIGTIRYVSGDFVFLTLARTLQIGLFLLLVKTMYQLVNIVVNSFLVQKPLSIVKKFVGL